MYQESETLKLNREYTHDLLKEIVALANTKGGIIYIGIDDNGQIIGVDAPERLIEKISSLIHDSIKPDLTCFSEIACEMADDRPIVKIAIQRGTKRPYYIRDKGLKPSGVYIRLGNTSVPATESAIRNMIAESDDAGFEKTRSINQDLTFKTAEEEFKAKQIPFGKAQQRTMGILDADGIYSNLGLLLSDQCQHTIKAAVFRGVSQDEFQTRREFGGSLFQQLNEAYAFIDLNNHLRSTFQGLQRIDNRDYPEAALREALLNALIHRDYSFSGSILISIFSDRLEIVSLGGLVAGLEPEDIFEGISQARNSGLANIFYRLNYIEAYGTGIRKIRQECAKFGVQADFHITNAAFRVVIPNRHVVGQTSDDLGMDQQAILQYIRDHQKASRKEIQNALQIKQTKCGLLLKDLENRKLIVRSGASRAVVYTAA